MHLIITDSGLGGLSVCAAIEETLREKGHDVRITYVNAWPEEGRGYNDLPGMQARARQFDLTLRRMADMAPDRILIACNTLSILYELTEFRAAPAAPVQGIVAAGLDLFHQALADEPGSSIVLLGTRTTIDSGVHRERLVQRGVSPERIAAASCHGLATAIERGPASADTAALIDTCAESASRAAQPGEPLFAGLCCTHYGMVADRIAAALAGRTGRQVLALDPNTKLAHDVASEIARARGNGGRIEVEVISKVRLSADQQGAVAAVIERVSPATAAALRGYRHVPGLF